MKATTIVFFSNSGEKTCIIIFYHNPILCYPGWKPGREKDGTIIFRGLLKQWEV